MIFQKCCNVSKAESISTPSFADTISNHSRLSKECYREFCKEEVDKEVVVIKSCIDKNVWYDREAAEEDFYLKRRRRHSENSCLTATLSEESCGDVTNRSSSSKILDWITMCFWKCSPGCQELGTIST